MLEECVLIESQIFLFLLTVLEITRFLVFYNVHQLHVISKVNPTQDELKLRFQYIFQSLIEMIKEKEYKYLSYFRTIAFAVPPLVLKVVNGILQHLTESIFGSCVSFVSFSSIIPVIKKPEIIKEKIIPMIIIFCILFHLCIIILE